MLKQLLAVTPLHFCMNQFRGKADSPRLLLTEVADIARS
jgi:hypothetical protein